MTDAPALFTEHLTKRFGEVLAVDDVDLSVPRGVVFGYLGPNGAGKTTTIRMLLGLIRPTSGRARVNGHDAWEDREDAHRSLGYLPGDFTAYPDLTAAQYLEYLGNLRGGVDRSEVDKLAERLDLRMDVPFGTLSHGNRQKVGIVQAFMHRPELLVLDEPTAGLDPLMQQEFLAMVREARAEGRTVFMSSHVLGEVEACADVVGMLGDGRLLRVDRVEALRHQAVHHLTLTFGHDPPLELLAATPGVRDLTADGRRVSLSVDGPTSDLFTVAAPHRIETIVAEEPDLEDIFLDLYAEER